MPSVYINYDDSDYREKMLKCFYFQEKSSVCNIRASSNED